LKPINDYIKNPNTKIGGCLVTLTGPPGCGKTNSLTQLAVDRFNEDHKVIWRATAQAQWAALLANDIPVKLWVDDNIESFEAWVSSQNNGVKDIDLDEKLSEIEFFESTDSLVKNASKKHVNVVIIPGLMGDQHEKYYFRYTWIKLLKSLVERKDVANPFSFFTDEGGDIWPCQQQLRKPFYKLVAEDTPPLLAQLRKQNVFMYIAAHSTHDLHYFVWKIKGNTIGYMSNSNVKRDIHTEVDQSKVNVLDRGELIVPPKDRASFRLAYEAEDLEWVGRDNLLRMSWESDIPNLLEDEDDKEEDEEVKEIDVKKSIAKSLYLSDLDLSQSQVAGLLDMSQGSVSNAVNGAKG